ncbi:hypothetical protein HAX54_023916, partial [Datura stramonium]|nr:hypothetical protein [Datura stramonium]
ALFGKQPKIFINIVCSFVAQFEGRSSESWKETRVARWAENGHMRHANRHVVLEIDEKMIAFAPHPQDTKKEMRPAVSPCLVLEILPILVCSSLLITSELWRWTSSTVANK